MIRVATSRVTTLTLGAVLVATATLTVGCAAAGPGMELSREASRPEVTPSVVTPSSAPSASPSASRTAASSAATIPERLADEPAEQSPPALGDDADQPAAPAPRTFVHGDVLEGYESPQSGLWPGRPEYAGIDWSTFRGYWTAEGHVVLVDYSQPIPAAVVDDLQARLDSMGLAGGVEIPDANGIRPSQDLVLRVEHVGKQLITVRPYPAAETVEWRASTGGSTLFAGPDRDSVVRQAQDWVSASSKPVAWVVAAASRS